MKRCIISIVTLALIAVGTFTFAANPVTPLSTLWHSNTKTGLSAMTGPWLDSFQNHTNINCCSAAIGATATGCSFFLLA